MPKRRAAINVGNSRISWFLWPEEEAGAFPVTEKLPQSLKEELSPREIYLASVNPERAARLREEIGMAVKLLGEDIRLPIRNLTRKPEQVGLDRLLVALGACRALGTAIAVDFGTAITVNLVRAGSEGPEFLGGAILPGLDLSLRALSEGTSKLPLLELKEPPDLFLGRTTEEAVKAGVFWSLSGGIRFLIERFQEEEAGARIAATGGSAPLFVPHLATEVYYDPYLLFRGVEACFPD